MPAESRWRTAWRYGAPTCAALLMGLVVWRQWPLELSVDDIGTLVWAFFGLMCVAAPGEVTDLLSLRGGGYSSFTGREAAALRDDDVVQVFGLVILIDAISGWGKWLVWRW